MKQIKINAFEKGLVFKNDRLIRVLEQGRYWLGWNEKLEKFSVLTKFAPIRILDIYLEEPAFLNAIQLIELGEEEIALVFEQNRFLEVLDTGRHIFWKENKQLEFQRFNRSDISIPDNIDRSLLYKTPMAEFVRFYTVEAYEKGLLFIDGKLERALEPGVYAFWKNSMILTVYKADMRAQQLELNGQEILTRDKANLRINCSVQYKVLDLQKLVQNKEYEKHIYVAVQLALREQIGAYTLDDLLEKRESLAPALLEELKQKASVLGIELLSCGIRDIILPGDMKEILNQVLIAEKKAQATAILRREETASTRSLLNTARLMEENQVLYKLKEMEYVERIAEKVGSIHIGADSGIAGQLKKLVAGG